MKRKTMGNTITDANSSSFTSALDFSSNRVHVRGKRVRDSSINVYYEAETGDLVCDMKKELGTTMSHVTFLINSTIDARCVRSKSSSASVSITGHARVHEPPIRASAKDDQKQVICLLTKEQRTRLTACMMNKLQDLMSMRRMRGRILGRIIAKEYTVLVRSVTDFCLTGLPDETFPNLRLEDLACFSEQERKSNTFYFTPTQAYLDGTHICFEPTRRPDKQEREAGDAYLHKAVRFAAEGQEGEPWLVVENDTRRGPRGFDLTLVSRQGRHIDLVPSDTVVVLSDEEQQKVILPPYESL